MVSPIDAAGAEAAIPITVSSVTPIASASSPVGSGEITSTEAPGRSVITLRFYGVIFRWRTSALFRLRCPDFHPARRARKKTRRAPWPERTVMGS
jgi:hypothetical protein